MTDDAFEAQLPDDLKPVADALRANRVAPDAPLLERVQQRVSGPPPSRRRRRLLTPRAAATVALALAVVIGAKLSHVNVASDVATLAGSVTQPVSNTPNGSASGAVYCGEGSGSGSSGWAPSFRWHYGYPSPDTPKADDGWSQSVQPSCPGGSLSIRWSDDSVNVTPGNPIRFGYDFHQASKPAFTMTAYNLLVVFMYKCGSGPTKTFSPTSLNPETWTGGTHNDGTTYNSPAFAPDWIPTGTKTDALGFQGTLNVPALCGSGAVTFTGGTFSATIKIT